MDDSNAFSALKSHDHWNPGDRSGGIYNKIQHDLPNLTSSLTGMIESNLQDYPEALSFCLELFNRSLIWLEAFCTKITSFNRYLLMTTYGIGVSYTSKQQEVVWEVVLRMIKVVFREFRIPLSKAQHAYASITDPQDLNSTYLWACIQAHQIMQEFWSAGGTLKFTQRSCSTFS